MIHQISAVEKTAANTMSVIRYENFMASTLSPRVSPTGKYTFEGCHLPSGSESLNDGLKNQYTKAEST